MNIEELREYCLSVKGANESFPFDETVLVFKVMNKMFAYTSIDPSEDGFWVSVKCDPEKAIDLRERYTAVIPGIHANKKLWNSINQEGDMSDIEIKQWIDHSVEEVINKLPKKQQEIYKNMANEE
ncbi:MmcQ/YjbR family DNA-binding protein [Dysgonomonas sp. 216]|uniref:MmcQ/YjbR family DNA-binding protein n=1 Tax=Dysgonomonas sp. 216 TaxID=2302934 RepID=UPI0013D4FDFF|nr:MmcQ/YjbR family DNA-binding protein [Dysgonomonas sp. 216]NDW18335.1 MmcQ/YjbR family DNA-binding protein [Dysgonomonas sp. 216]NDW18703.1 MmcQ/YjbR family DNA-binding protein [Dysgonomonas sp. 216]